MDTVAPSDLVDPNWEDEELEEDIVTNLNPNWITVSDPRGLSAERFQVAALVSEQLDNDEIACARNLVLIGRPLGSCDNKFRRIGSFDPNRYDDAEPLLMMDFGETAVPQLVFWESADAAIFLKLAEQVLPEIGQEETQSDFGD
jgi:hypothetical protein